MIDNNPIVIKCCVGILCWLLVWYVCQLAQVPKWKYEQEPSIIRASEASTNSVSTIAPTTTSTSKRVPSSTEAHKSLNRSQVSLKKHRHCRLVVCSIGNLGNQIWEYMSLYVVWKRFIDTDYIPYIQYSMWENLKVLFPKLSIRAKSYGICDYPSDRIIARTEPLNKYDSWFTDDRKCKDIVLDEYSSRYDEILKYGVKEIRKEMRYSEELVENYQKDMHMFKKAHGFENETVTFVGVHYRGTDYVKHLEINYGNYHPVLPDYRYYIQSMKYFKQRYPNVVFILISIDGDWLLKNTPFMSEMENVIVNPYVGDRLRDLVLLSHCNHSIISYGTFAVTSALFAGGETIVYDLKLPLDHRGTTLAMGIAQIMDNWHSRSNEDDYSLFTLRNP